MENNCTIQLFCDGIWHDVATVSLFGHEGEGWRARTYSGYSVEWAFSHGKTRDAHALACQVPVGLEPVELPHWPVFLIDMLPQGFGRHEMLRRLEIPATAQESADWRLLKAGAGNPIGNLRIKEAALWLFTNGGPTRGFSAQEVALRSDDFAEYLASHGLFVAGSSGVQGEWPKVLLTRADDGLLYLDHTLDDARAREHYIVKFGRGSDGRLASILRHEAPYMGLAQRLGLRVHAPLVLKERALFIRRFDRVVGALGVQRLAQESIATLTGMPGFDAVPSHDQVCSAMMARCSDPQAEVLEYIKRDIANLALGNKDNHARNTALQRDFSGGVRLTPLYDFAPMYLHPDGIARRIRWENNDAGSTDWSRVVNRISELEAQGLARVRRKRQKAAVLQIQRDVLVAGLRAMIAPLQDIALNGQAMGLEPDVLAHVRPSILAQVQRLSALN